MELLTSEAPDTGRDAEEVQIEIFRRMGSEESLQPTVLQSKTDWVNSNTVV
jgi:hypothetical protein